jgi:hypothetical protein
MKSMSRILPVFLMLTVSAPRARAFDGWFSNRDDCAPCTRHAYGEYGAAHACSKHLAYLDCRELAVFAERSRMLINQRIAAAYNGPLAAASAAVPPPAIPAPAAEPTLTPAPVTEPTPPPAPATVPDTAAPPAPTS